MIATAAVIVRLLVNSLFLRDLMLLMLQLQFVCGPDATLSEKGIGPSGVDWRRRFTHYKLTILRFSEIHRNNLLAWYDTWVFGASNSVSHANPDNRGDDGAVDAIDKLIQQMDNTDVTSPVGSPTPPDTSQCSALPSDLCHHPGSPSGTSELAPLPSEPSQHPAPSARAVLAGSEPMQLDSGPVTSTGTLIDEEVAQLESGGRRSARTRARRVLPKRGARK
jgi:hypothetical protein